MVNPYARTCGIFAAALLGRLGGVAAGIGVGLPLDGILNAAFSGAEAQERAKAKSFCLAMADEVAIVGPRDEGTRDAVCLAIETAIRRFPIDHRRLAELSLDPARATAELAPRLTFATRAERTELEAPCKDLIHRFYEKLPRHAHVLAEMLPDLWAVVLQRQDKQDRKLDALFELNRRQLELLEQEKGIPHAALVEHLIRLGADERIEPAQVPAFLERFANEFATLREQWSGTSNTDPGIVGAREEALEHLNRGELEDARRLFRSTRERIRVLRQERARDEATLLSDEAAVDRTGLRYRDAAALLAEAADLTAFDPETSWRHRLAQASVLDELGREFGDNAALTEAIAVHEKALDLAPRNSRPADWAVTQNDLGIALWALGERESGTETLQRAVRAYELALEERTRQRVPLHWATTQNNLGNALLALGKRESGTETLRRAVRAYALALEEWTRERVPLDWATTQNNLGSALATLGQRESDTETLRRAVHAFELALEERTRERVPLDWAMTQNNLGNALLALGQRESSTETLRRAVRAFELALEEQTRERVPLDWATTQNNLGNALQTLGKRESGTETLQRAVRAYGLALEEWNRERVPLDWATTQNNLGNALLALGQRESGTETLQRAVRAFELALEELTRERVPLDWATTQNNLGAALQALGERESGTETLRRAVRAYELALEELTRERVPHLWALTQENVAMARFTIGQRTGDPDELRAALAAVDEALEEYRAGNAAHYIAKAERLRADIVAALES